MGLDIVESVGLGLIGAALASVGLLRLVDHRSFVRTRSSFERSVAAMGLSVTSDRSEWWRPQFYWRPPIETLNRAVVAAGIPGERQVKVALRAGLPALDRFGGLHGGTTGGYPVEELLLRARGRYYSTAIDVAFTRPLGSGLRVRRTDVSGYGALRLGDALLDAHYEVLATHPEAARAVLLARPVRRALVSAVNAGLQLAFDGDGITVVLTSHVVERDALRSAVQATTRLAEALESLS